MKSDYEQKRKKGAERARYCAAKAQSNATDAYNRVKGILSNICPGQPILVGHHSEKRHRRDLEKTDNLMRKSINEDKKAVYFLDKAERLEDDNSGVISSDDPKALEKLRAKVDELEKRQSKMKTINVAYRAFAKKGIQALEGFDLTDEDKLFIAGWQPAYSFETAPVQQFSFTNLNAKIKAAKARILHLEKLSVMTDSEITVGDIVAKAMYSENRMMLIFPGKPDRATIDKLKRNGFRWAPSQGAWMRQMSNAAIYAAKDILRPFKEALAQSNPND